MTTSQKESFSKEPSMIWKKLDALFEESPIENWIPPLRQLCDSKVNLTELSKSAKMLADLHAHNAKDEHKRRGVGYGILSALCFVKMKRMAPALATVDWLRQINNSQTAVALLESLISKEFSDHTTTEFKPSDHDTQPQSQELIAEIRENFKSEETLDYPEAAYPFFSELPMEEVQAIIKRAKVTQLSESDIIFNEGDEPGSFYLVAEGLIELTSERGFSKDFSEGEFFGELGVLGNMPRTATMTAKSKSTVIEFSKELLVECFAHFPELEKKILKFFNLRLFLNTANADAVLSKLSAQDQLDFFYSFTPEFAKSSSLVCKEGDPSDSFYFIVSGHCEVKTKDDKKFLLGPGNFFGEEGFLEAQPRNLNVKAISDLHYLRCEDYMFKGLQRNLPQIEQVLRDLIVSRKAARDSCSNGFSLNSDIT